MWRGEQPPWRNPVAHRRPCLTRWAAIAALLVAGCSSGSAHSVGLDGEVPLPDVPVRDVRTSEGPVPVNDSGQQADAAPRDAAPACTPGACVPTGDAICATGGVCVLGEALPACVRDRGTLGATLPCMTSSECAAGLACFASRGGGVCAAVCCAPGDCAPGERCGGTALLAGGVITDWLHCIGPRACDALGMDTACEADEGCYIVDAAGGTDCRRAGTRPLGAPCAEQTDCAPGAFCAGLVARTCTRICRLGDPCPPGEGTCIRYSSSQVGTGLCTPAPVR